MADARKRIGVDLTALTPQHTGVDRFLTSLVEHLALAPSDFRFYLFVNREDLPLFRARFPEHFRVYGTCFRPRLARLFFQQVILPLAVFLLRLDTLHSPSFIMPLWRGRALHVLTIHDLTTMTIPSAHIPLRRSKLFSLLMAHSIRKAHVVHVPSRFVQEDIGQHIARVDPARIRVIPHGIAKHFDPKAVERTPEVMKSLSIPAPYMLYLGNIDPRKNLELLVHCYSDLVARGAIAEHLVIAGPLGWEYDAFLEMCRSEEVRERIHLTGYVPEADLPALLAGARLFVYPSRQEGFGFPPLEAMACGVPVIVTQSSSLAENLEGAASLVPVADAAALGREIERLLSDEALRAERRERGLARAAQFSWESCAADMLAAYDEPREGAPESSRPGGRERASATRPAAVLARPNDGNRRM